MLVAALILGRAAFGAEDWSFRWWCPPSGALTAVLGIYLTRPRPGEPPAHDQPRFYVSAVARRRLLAGRLCLPASLFLELDGGIEHDDPRSLAALAVIVGIVLAGIMWLTGYFTGTNRRPVRRHRPATSHRPRDGVRPVQHRRSVGVRGLRR